MPRKYMNVLIPCAPEIPSRCTPLGELQRIAHCLRVGFEVLEKYRIVRVYRIIEVRCFEVRIVLRVVASLLRSIHFHTRNVLHKHIFYPYCADANRVSRAELANLPAYRTSIPSACCHPLLEGELAELVIIDLKPLPLIVPGVVVVLHRAKLGCCAILPNHFTLGFVELRVKLFREQLAKAGDDCSFELRKGPAQA